jgi:hypothetical protein
MARKKKRHQKEHTLSRKELKQKAVDYKGGACVVCGYRKVIGALSFHHRDPAKKEFGISRLISSIPWSEVEKELSSCEIVCLNCHVEIHAGLIDGYIDGYVL